MFKYNKLITKFINTSYWASTNFSKNFLKKYKLQRTELIKLIDHQKNQISSYGTKSDPTYEKLKKKNFLGIKKRDEKEIVIFYKKFETNLKLKKKYDLNFKKLSNLETKYDSYIFLGLLVVKCKKLDFYQKINCILKIIDKLSLEVKNINKDNLILFKKLLLIEKKFIQNII